MVDRREIAELKSIRPALPAFLVGVARSLVDTTVVVADVLPSSSGRSLRTAVETFGCDDSLCAADTREPRTGVVRPAAAVARRRCTLERLPAGTIQVVRLPWAAASTRPAPPRWFRIPFADL